MDLKQLAEKVITDYAEQAMRSLVSDGPGGSLHYGAPREKFDQLMVAEVTRLMETVEMKALIRQRVEEQIKQWRAKPPSGY